MSRKKTDNQPGAGWNGLMAGKPPKTQPANRKSRHATAASEAPTQKPELKYPMPADDVEARAWLVDLAEHLERLRFPTSTIPIQRAQYAAGAIKKYLKDTEARERSKNSPPSGIRSGPLERAFGLSKPRGAPTTKELEHIGIARKMLVHKLKNSTNIEIMAAEEIDENTLREWERHLAKHEVTVLSEELSRQMSMTSDQLATDPLLRALAQRPPRKPRKLPGVQYNGDQCCVGYWSETAPQELTWVCCNPLCKTHQM